MFKFLFIFLFSLQAFAIESNNSCSSVFETHRKTEIHTLFESIIYNDSILEKIDDVRIKYDDTTVGEKSGASLLLISILRELDHLPYENARSESEKHILQTGVDNIIQDLVHISPRLITTRRLMTENAAIINALLSKEAGKFAAIERSGNILYLSTEIFATNSYYLAARKALFELIDSYRIQDHLSMEIRGERIEELLTGDSRFTVLNVNDRSTLLSRLLAELISPEYPGAEIVLDKYFAERGKSRL